LSITSTAVETSAKTETRRTVYARRVPEDTVLYGVVSDQLRTFFAHAESAGRRHMEHYHDIKREAAALEKRYLGVLGK
jgi:hypothetical protein